MSGIANFVAWAQAQPASTPAPKKPLYGPNSRIDRAMIFLARGKGKTNDEIAAAIGITSNSMHRVIVSMVQKNLIVSPGERDNCKTWRVA